MRATIMHAPGDVRVEERPKPTIQQPTGAIIKLVAACVCGSDLWPYRGAVTINEAAEGCKAMDERRAIKVLLRP